MITAITKRKTPTAAPTTATILGSAVSDFNSTKNTNKSVESDKKQTIVFVMTKNLKCFNPF